jgi:hypothetical protein
LKHQFKPKAIAEFPDHFEGWVSPIALDVTDRMHRQPRKIGKIPLRNTGSLSPLSEQGTEFRRGKTRCIVDFHYNENLPQNQRKSTKLQHHIHYDEYIKFSGLFS